MLDIAAIKDALSGLEGHVNHRPVSVEPDEPAAVHCPQEARAGGIIKGPPRRNNRTSRIVVLSAIGMVLFVPPADRAMVPAVRSAAIWSGIRQNRRATLRQRRVVPEGWITRSA